VTSPNVADDRLMRGFPPPPDRRVHVVREAGEGIAMFSPRPAALDDELGAHVFAACEDLARLLADDDRPLRTAGAEGD
jgi:hypothetical protein